MTPFLFGVLIQTHDVWVVFYGFLIGAFLMVAAGVVAIFFGIDAEGKSLESVAHPLSAEKTRSAGKKVASALSPHKNVSMQ